VFLDATLTPFVGCHAFTLNLRGKISSQAGGVKSVGNQVVDRYTLATVLRAPLESPNQSTGDFTALDVILMM
jgi:hypothetical protein